MHEICKVYFVILLTSLQTGFFNFFSFCMTVESEAVGEPLAAEGVPSLTDPSSLSPSDNALFLSPEPGPLRESLDGRDSDLLATGDW